MEMEISSQIADSLCRTCMESTNSSISLFDTICTESREEPLNYILLKCTSIEVKKSDSFPLFICEICLRKLKECYLFQVKCYQTQKLLEQTYNKNQNSIHFNESDPLQVTKSEILLQNYEKIETTDLNIQGFPNCDKKVDLHNPNSDILLQNRDKVVEKCTDLSIEDDFPNCDNQLQFVDDSCVSFTDCDNENITSVNKIRKFCCSVCSKRFWTMQILNKHIIASHSDPERLTCGICSKKFTRITDVKRHMSTHTGAKPYSCTLCQSTFTQSGSLSVHMKKHHQTNFVEKVRKSSQVEESHHLCSMCGKSFRYLSSLTVHLRRHKGERPYSCEICPKRFVTGSLLNAHIRMHTGERPFPCKFCEKFFSQSSVLKKHIKSHFSTNYIACNFCSKSFSSIYYLNIHKRKHTGERPLKCSLCPKSFSDPKILKEHQVIHTGEKPFLCVVCGKNFRRSHHLKTHMKIHSQSSELI